MSAAWHDSLIGIFMDEAESKYEPTKPMSKDDAEALRQRLTIIKQFCARYGLVTSVRLVDAKLSELPTSSGEMKLLELAIKSELDTHPFFQLEASRVQFYEKDDLLSERAQDCFPLAHDELRQGGNCYALGLYTASVFHSMRALEHGIKSLAQDVGLTYDIQNWQNILDQIESKLREEGKKTNSPQKQERLKFLSEANAEFRHFKDAWRNHVSHNKTAYDDTQARRVLDHACTFIETLSTQLRE